MFTALAPLWLWTLPPILTFGLLALWRGRHYRHRVSSTALWHGLPGESSGRKPRLIDPLWAIILLAALLAALTLPGITLQLSAEPARPHADALLQMRALAPSPTAELYFRATTLTNLATTSRLEIGPPEKPLASRQATPDELTRGFIVAHLPILDHADVRLLSAGQLAAAWTLDRVARPPFAVVTLGPVSPALRRVMHIQPGAITTNPALRPAIWLIDDPNFDPRQFLPGRGAIIIASPRTPLDGLTFLDTPPTAPATTVVPTPSSASSPGIPATPAQPLPATTASAGWVPEIATNSPLLEMSPGHPISLRDVRVTRFRRATLSPDWQTLLTVNGLPWLATRRNANGAPAGGIDWFYLASDLSPSESWDRHPADRLPTSDTNWPTDPSFVILFTNIANRISTAGAAGGIEEWQTHTIPLTPPTNSSPTRYNLTPLFALAALLLLLIAIPLFLRRARR